jgi:16S rRNA U1498 N3-methylase RsmE
MNLLLIEPAELDADNVAAVDGARARHLRQVLGAEPGRQVRVGLVDGPIGTGTVVSIDESHARLGCVFDAATPPVPPIDLLLALPRPKVLRRLWAQLAALGVGRIVLTNAARVERNYFDTTVLDPAVYRPLLIEGLQQARDTRVPVVTVHRQFRILVEDDLDRMCPQPARLLADPGEGGPIRDGADTRGGPWAKPVVVPGLPQPGGAALRADDEGTAPRRRPDTDRILLAVGPEGGWNDFERHLLESRGFRRISLGPRTLRTDTACIALHAVVSRTAAV